MTQAFEDKCKRLYDVRLTEYAEKTGQQIAQYEEQLLEVCHKVKGFAYML